MKNKKLVKMILLAILPAQVFAWDITGMDFLMNPFNFNPMNPTHQAILNQMQEKDADKTSKERELRCIHYCRKISKFCENKGNSKDCKFCRECKTKKQGGLDANNASR